ncbi:MAG: hypothetical protein WAV20_09445 [Blastocatellia bacterium]
MFERIKRILFRLSAAGDPGSDEAPDDRDAGVPVPVKRGSPDRGSAVAVAEPNNDE